MKKTVQALSIVFTAVFIAFICQDYASGNMIIMLKDGRTVNVPVSKDDIVSLSFDEASGPASVSDGMTWDFESGDLRGWTKTGDAFNMQPTYGDNPTARHRGQPSRHQGDYWIGGYENRQRPSDPAGRTQGDGPQGTLTSRSFTIRGPVISFLIGGGCDINTERAELIVNGQVVLKVTGKCTETMERVLWDVTPYSGQRAQIRLVDASSGGWGHINFDDIRFE
jgi:hypothetical protein